MVHILGRQPDPEQENRPRAVVNPMGAVGCPTCKKPLNYAIKPVPFLFCAKCFDWGYHPILLKAKIQLTNTSCQEHAEQKEVIKND